MIPKNFIPGKNRKLKIEKPKKSIKTTKELEDLIIDEVDLDYTAMATCEADINLTHLGVSPTSIKKALRIRYYRDHPLNYQEDILLVEYKSKSLLEENFKGIYEAGMRFETGTVYESFLSKNNFAIFIFIRENDIIKKAIEQYRNAGFKQLERTLRQV